MTIHWEEVRQDLSQTLVIDGAWIEIRNDKELEKLLVFDDLCEHELADDLCRCGLDFDCVVEFEGFGKHAVEGALLDGAGFAIEDCGAVGGEDVGDDVEGFDLEGFVTFVEAVGEKG